MARILSATSGVLMRLVVQRGIPTDPLSFFVTHVNAPRGTIVAIVGTLASCQPIPVLMMLAPLRVRTKGYSLTCKKFSDRKGFMVLPCLDLLCKFNHLLPRGTALHQVEHRQSVNNDEIVTTRLTNSFNNFNCKSHAVFV